jgi:hypothetical protein
MNKGILSDWDFTFTYKNSTFIYKITLEAFLNSLTHTTVMQTFTCKQVYTAINFRWVNHHASMQSAVDEYAFRFKCTNNSNGIFELNLDGVE